MFHGWQEHRQNNSRVFGPWMMPFDRAFDMSHCSRKYDYSNWNWLPKYRTSDEEIAKSLKKEANEVQRNFWTKMGEIAKHF